METDTATAECANSMIGHLLALLDTTVGNATTIFNMFLTVVFGSFAFAAAISLRNIGRPIKLIFFKLSASSLWVGFSLLAFYVLSFNSFNNSINLANDLVKEVRDLLRKCGEKTQIFDSIISNNKDYLDLPLASWGFIIGSVIGFGIFLWISNVDRKQII